MEGHNRGTVPLGEGKRFAVFCACSGPRAKIVSKTTVFEGDRKREENCRQHLLIFNNKQKIKNGEILFGQRFLDNQTAHSADRSQ
jgi:hypothetical protein